MLDRNKYDNVIIYKENDIIDLLAMHHGIDSDDIHLIFTIDANGQIHVEGEIGIVEPEREISFTDHY